ATVCGVDPLRKLFVRTGNAAAPFVYWDLSTPGSGNHDVRVTPVDPSGEFPTLLASGNVTLPNCGFDFDARRNRFALWCGDGRVWMLTPPATASPLGWTIQKQRAPTRAIPNGDVGTGILGKWKYIPNLDAFIGLQDYTLGNIWIYKPVGWVNPQQPLALAAPTSVNASDGTSTANVAVTWKAVSGATSYSVYRSTTAGSQGTLLGSTASLSFLDSSATAGVTYFYGVTASGGGSTSALSAQDSGFRAGALSSNLNVALAANGGVATASSTNGPGFPPGATIDNQRSGAGWGAGGGWNDASFGQFPDWLQVTFSSLRSIDRVVVYSVQDNYVTPVEPSDTMTFTLRGITDFTVQGFDGANWVTLASVTGNQLVKRSVAFTAFTTDRIRVKIIKAGDNGWSRLTEVEAWSSQASLTSKSNVALASNGGVATASSTNGPGFLPGTVIDNKRSGAGWGAGGGWNDATLGVFPDWIQVNFTGTRTIDRVVVYSVQDNYLTPVEPTNTMTFSLRGISDFNVQGFNGSTWVTLATISGNRLVKRSVTFPPFATDRIRVNIVNALGNNWSRVTEVEAWGL
ncbi:MAG TPA: discoidin domain-containing protein, partial [Ilumatobacteraceae bacterium]|nr:discoidin domain-containing protein [Ilumatobacteraceae bacterium]